MGLQLAAAYQREGDWLFHSYPLESGGDLRFQAKDIRRGRWGTGIHSLVGIAVDGHAIAYSNINVERDEERGKLIRTAHKSLGEVHQGEFPEQRLKSCIDGFCYGLWDASVEQYAGGLMAGDFSLGPPTRILGDYLLEQAGTLFYAPPGAGKSYTLLAMAVSADAGVDTLWPVQQRNAGYVNLERAGRSLQYRLAGVNQALGLDPARPLPFLNARGKGLLAVLDGVHKMIETYKLDVVMLDSISRAGFGSLVADDTANEVIDALNGFGTAWGALAHSPRGDDSHIFGSVHFEAGQDVGVKLLSQRSSDGMTLGVGLQVTQANDVRTGGLSFIALDFDERTGLTAIRPSNGREFPDIASQRPLNKADAIAEYLLGVGKDAAPEIAEAVGYRRDEVSRELSRNSRFVSAGKDGRKLLYAVRQQ